MFVQVLHLNPFSRNATTTNIHALRNLIFGRTNLSYNRLQKFQHISTSMSRSCREYFHCFNLTQALNPHLNLGIHSIACHRCKSKFHCKDDLQSIWIRRLTFRCEDCVKTFTNSGGLQQNLYSFAHMHECHLCSKKLRSPTSLRQHLESPALILECPRCDRTLRNDNALQQNLHYQAHAHSCRHSERLFKSSEADAQHNNSRHSINCLRCDRSCGSRKAIAQHFIDSHLDVEGITRVTQSPVQPSTGVTLTSKIVDDETLIRFEGVGCAICTDLPTVGDVVSILSCNHWFHDLWIRTWVAQNATCPNFRWTVRSKDGWESSERYSSDDEAADKVTVKLR